MKTERANHSRVLGGTLGRYTGGAGGGGGGGGSTSGISHGGRFAATLGSGSSVLGTGYNGSVTLGRRPINHGSQVGFANGCSVRDGHRQQAVVAPICRETDL